jgi:hypothetical protein
LFAQRFLLYFWFIVLKFKIKEIKNKRNKKSMILLIFFLILESEMSGDFLIDEIFKNSQRMRIKNRVEEKLLNRMIDGEKGIRNKLKYHFSWICLFFGPPKTLFPFLLSKKSIVQNRKDKANNWAGISQYGARNANTGTESTLQEAEHVYESRDECAANARTISSHLSRRSTAGNSGCRGASESRELVLFQERKEFPQIVIPRLGKSFKQRRSAREWSKSRNTQASRIIVTQH